MNTYKGQWQESKRWKKPRSCCSKPQQNNPRCRPHAAFIHGMFKLVSPQMENVQEKIDVRKEQQWRSGACSINPQSDAPTSLESLQVVCQFSQSRTSHYEVQAVN